MINKKRIRPIYSFLLPILVLLCCNGCREAILRIDALPYQEKEGDLWGLIGTDGQVKNRYGTFEQQPSAVVNGMFTLQDKEGGYQLYQAEHPQQPVNARRFFQIGYFFETVTLAQETPGSPILIIDQKGRTVHNLSIGLHYDIIMAHNFSEGKALFCTREGKYGFMNTKGEVVIPPLYDQAFSFHEGIALVGKANEKGEIGFLLIDSGGNLLSSIQVASSLLDEQFSSGLLKYSSDIDGKCGYLNQQGETELYLPDSISEAYRFEHDAAIVQTIHGTGLIDRAGKIRIAPKYEDGFIAGPDRVCFRQNSYWKLYDFDGNPIWNAKTYDQVTDFYPSRTAVVYKNNRYSWIDTDGKVISNKQYATIIEDKYARQQIPQIFVRRNSPNIQAEQKPTITEPEQNQMTVPTRQKLPNNCVINSEEWRNISKQSPFYAEASKILSGKIAETDAENRQMILNYVEHLRTSYTTKDIDFLSQLFSEDALIIVGTVIRNVPKMEGQYLSTAQVAYNVKSKRVYLDRLKILFKKNKEIKLKFSEFKILRHPTQKGIYGVTLRQKYSSDLYSDDGYLFLLWDFRDEATPLIHVRTWQPSMLDSQTPLSEKEIFNIRNFNLQ